MLSCIFFVTLVSLALSEECVKFDFEEGFEALFGSDGACRSSSAVEWSRNLYQAAGPVSPHHLSRSFIRPRPGRTSCTSSFPFEMHAQGFLQVNVNMQLLNNRDLLNVMVYKKVSSGADQLVTSLAMDRLDADYRIGQNALNITLPETTETFEGYMVLIGTAVASSVMYVDSFRYIAPGLDETRCVIYEDETTTTQISVTEPATVTYTTEHEISTTHTYITETDIAITTTDPSITKPEIATACKTYTFGNDFKDIFSKRGFCRFLGDWEVNEDFKEVNTVEGFHPNSKSYISPVTAQGCTSSDIFEMSTAGQLEINVYLKTEGDEINVLVYEIEEDGTEKFVLEREIFYNSSAGKLVPFKVPLSGSTVVFSNTGDNSDDVGGDDTNELNHRTFKGYFSLVGQATATSIVLVDSFKYYSPSANGSNCILYADDTSCVTYNFMDSENTNFNQDGLCRFLSNWKWERNVNFIGLNGSHPNSNSYIVPGSSDSCTSSNSFEMSTDGILEVNYYKEKNDDEIVVMISEIDDDGAHKFIKEENITGTTDNKLVKFKMNLAPTFRSVATTFTGYITLIGKASTSDSTTVFVDSIRYYGPTEENTCVIYEEITICEKYNFEDEDDFKADFNQRERLCSLLGDWKWEEKDSSIKGFDPKSNAYIVSDSISCTTSDDLKMSTDGILEVNYYTENDEDELYVSVTEINDNGSIKVIKEKDAKGKDGYNTLKMCLFDDECDTDAITSRATFTGYITIIGTATTGSKVLVDSFRFYNPAMDNKCVIYED